MDHISGVAVDCADIGVRRLVRESALHERKNDPGQALEENQVSLAKGPLGMRGLGSCRRSGCGACHGPLMGKPARPGRVVPWAGGLCPPPDPHTEA